MLWTGLFSSGCALGTDSMPIVLTADQIAERMARIDLENEARIMDYAVIRRYTLDNKRFNSAYMIARLNFRTGKGKSFEILETNARGMHKHVFQKLIESEQSSDWKELEDQMRVSPENYSFRLIGQETLRGSPCYVLEIHPRKKTKYLLDGRVWVNQEDFGTMKVSGRTAGRISFWVGKADVDQEFEKIGPLWIAASNRSVAEVRLLGISQLAIEASDFKLNYLGKGVQTARARDSRPRPADAREMDVSR